MAATLALILATTASLAAGDRDRGVCLLDAREQGIFNTASARVNAERRFDPEFGAEVLQLRYWVPQGSAAGLWTKGLPERFQRCGRGPRAGSSQVRAVGACAGDYGRAGDQGHCPGSSALRWSWIRAGPRVRK